MPREREKEGDKCNAAQLNDTHKMHQMYVCLCSHKLLMLNTACFFRSYIFQAATIDIRKLKPIILANRSLKLFECPIMIVCGDFLIQRERVSDLLRARAGCTYLGPGTRREQRKTCPYKTQNIHRVKIISFCIGMFEFFGWHGMAWHGLAAMSSSV